MNEMEAEKENVRSTIERVFKAELLKITPSLQNTLIGDLISGTCPLQFKSNLTEYLIVFLTKPCLFLLLEAEVGASEVSIAMKVSRRDDLCRLSVVHSRQCTYVRIFLTAERVLEDATVCKEGLKGAA